MSRSPTERRAIPGGELRSLVAPPDLPLADEAALRAYARLQFSHFFGAAAQAWPLATWWRGEQRGACAWVSEAPPAAGLKSAVPTWAAALHHLAGTDPAWAGAPHAALALVEGQSLTWLRLREGRLIDLQQRMLSDAAELPALLRELQDGGEPLSQAPRLSGWSPLALPGLPASDADLPWQGARPARRSVLPWPDFIPAPRRTPALVWLWLGAAGLAVALAANQWREQRDEAQRLNEQAAVLAKLSPARSPRATAAAGVSDSAPRQRALAVARQLEQDWAGRWLAIESALPAGLSLQALELDARQLRLEGQASESDTVMRLVDRLAAPGSSGADEGTVSLTRLQRPERAEEGSALRFEVVRRAGALR